MDMVQAAGSGHVGTALSLAPLFHVLWSDGLKYDPEQPNWSNRDRFVLSSGHAASVLYAVMHLAGFDISDQELRSFRRYGSRLPGHPELGLLPGIEMTTGMLGQGLAAAVGMASAEQSLRAKFGAGLCDHRTIVVVGDGDMQEGISHEVCSLAGHWQLEHLICIYNLNRVTLDGELALSNSEDVASRFDSYGWRVNVLGDIGEDPEAIRKAITVARQSDGRPTLVVMETVVGRPAATLTGDHCTHGMPLGHEEVLRTKAKIGLPADEEFWIPRGVLDHYRGYVARQAEARRNWQDRLESDPRKDEFLACLMGGFQWNMTDGTSGVWPSHELLSPRDASQTCISLVSRSIPSLVAGSSDITLGTGTRLPEEVDFSAATPAGRQFRFGVREHGMVGIMLGQACHGGLLPVGGTYLAFSDYLRPALRLAGMVQAHLVLCLTHDGFDCAEDGPTHHAPEHLAALRTIRGIRVLRPANASEVVQAWTYAVAAARPVVLVLSREPVALGTAEREPRLDLGAYTVSEDDDPQLVLVGSGVDLRTCAESADNLRERGYRVRVVSAPCWEIFEMQDWSYQNAVLPTGLPRIIVEAGIAFGWGGRGRFVAQMDETGHSGPADLLRAQNGLVVESVVKVALESLSMESES